MQFPAGLHLTSLLPNSVEGGGKEDDLLLKKGARVAAARGRQHENLGRLTQIAEKAYFCFS